MAVLLTAALLLPCLSRIANAQPRLDFKRVTVNWPAVELYFTVDCNGQPVYSMSKQDMRIVENGVEDIRDFTLHCPDPSTRCAMSAALVLDATALMSGSSPEVKAAARAFIDDMDGTNDEAAFLYFAGQVTTLQEMTTMKPLLYSAVDAMPASTPGVRVTWDACHAGILELINNGSNDCRALVLLVDDADSASVHTPEEVTALANRHHIHMFTVGLGAQSSAAELETAAVLTGGRYYQASGAAQLSSIFREISSFIRDGFRECRITYDSACPDGQNHTVELRIEDFCSGTDARTRAYPAPLDTSVYGDLVMEIGRVAGPRGSVVQVPLRLVTPLDPQTPFPPISFILRWDRDCAQFVNVLPGNALSGIPLQLSPVQDGIRISTTAPALLKSSGPLLVFTFRTRDGEGTVCCELEAHDPVFATGCFNPVFLSQWAPDLALTHVRLAGDSAHAAFRMSDDWRYIPTVRPRDVILREEDIPVRHFNLHVPDSGSEAVTAMLLFDADGGMSTAERQGMIDAGLAFVDQMDGAQDRAAVAFFGHDFDLRRQWTTKRTDVRSAVSSYPTKGGSALWDACMSALKLYDGSVDARYRSLVVFSTRADAGSTNSRQYVIDEARDRGVHISVIRLQSGDADLLSVADATGGRAFTAAAPTELADATVETFHAARNGYGDFVLSWERFSCDDGNEHSLDLQVLTACTDVSHRFLAPLNNGAQVPFEVSIGTALSFGGQDITLPLRLDMPIDTTLLYGFNFSLEVDPAYLRFKHAAAPPGTLLQDMGVTWTGSQVTVAGRTFLAGTGELAYLTFECMPIEDTVTTSVAISAWNFDGGCLEPRVQPGTVQIYPPGSTPIVYCEIYGPGRLQWDRNSAGYVPNPFAVMARFPNAGNVTAKNARFVISFDSSKLQLIRPLDDTLSYSFADITPGSHAAVAWELWSPRLYRDDSTEVTVTALFDNHPPITCSTRIIVPRADAVLTCDLTLPHLTLDRSRGQLSPMPFTVTAQIRNVGARDADQVVAGIVLSDSLLPAGADAPDRFQKAISPSTLQPGGTATVEWTLETLPGRQSRTERIQVIVQSASTGASSCSEDLFIPAVDTSSFMFSLSIEGSTAICEGDSVVLNASGGRDSWHWNTGDSTQRIVVHDDGIYYCVVQVGARTGYSDTVRVTVRPAPAPVISLEGSLPLCAGDTLLLDAGSGYAEYAWSAGAMSQRIAVTHGGRYWVRVRDAHGCEGTSDAVDVHIVPPPRKPVIRRSGDLLLAQADGVLQWFHDGKRLDGEADQYLALAETGSYTVLVTDSNGCTAMSDPFPVSVLDAEGPPVPAHQFLVYPNPTGGRITFVLTLERAASVQVTLTDLLGRAVLRREYASSREIRATLSIPDVPDGVYLLRAQPVGRQVFTHLLLLRRR